MKGRNYLILIVFILSILIGGSIIYYPNNNSTSFSSDRAKEDLKAITKEPHSSLYHQEALSDVREYIVNELEKLDMNPQVFNYKNVEGKRGKLDELNNIYGKIDGKDGENGSYILLATHYDSADWNPQNEEGKAYSYGAADAGYGVVTLLETLRNIKESGKPLENGIKVLITDAEEMHLLGAGEEMDKNFNLYKNASYVINLEARGTSGPVLMYQTTEKNDRVLDLYRKGNYPMTTSVVTNLYKGAHRSDFYHFENKGLVGINFAPIDEVENYHTPQDSYENISDRSLKHYGDQVLPIVQEFVYSDKYNDVDYFKEGKEAIFFTILPNIVFDYSVDLGIVLSIILIVIIIGIMIKSRDKLKDVLKITGRNVLLIITNLLGGVIISFLLTNISGARFDFGLMGKVPGDDILVLILPIILLGFILKRELIKKDKVSENLLAGVLLQGILLSILIILLPGASYLAMIPLVLIIISMLIIKLVNNKIMKYTMLLPMIVMIILYIPIIYIFKMAFSIGALPLILVTVIIMKSLIVPIINNIY